MRIIGPDDTFDRRWFTEFARLTRGIVDVYTEHIYSMGEGNPRAQPRLSETVLKPQYLDRIKGHVRDVSGFFKDVGLRANGQVSDSHDSRSRKKAVQQLRIPAKTVWR